MPSLSPAKRSLSSHKHAHSPPSLSPCREIDGNLETSAVYHHAGEEDEQDDEQDEYQEGQHSESAEDEVLAGAEQADDPCESDMEDQEGGEVHPVGTEQADDPCESDMEDQEADEVHPVGSQQVSDDANKDTLHKYHYATGSCSQQFADVCRTEVQSNEENGSETEEGDADVAQDAQDDLMSEVPGNAEAPSVEQQVLPAAGSSASEALRSDVDAQWTVAQDICSMQVGGASLQLPRVVYDRLYTYQRNGLAWMWSLYHKGFGGILADDMGLGKTVQVAAFITCLRYAEQGFRFLVVVPVSLLEQWRYELNTWAHDANLAVHVFHGTPQERRKGLRGFLARGGVLLSSYDMVRNCIGQLKSSSISKEAAMAPKKRKRQNTRACRDDDDPSEEDMDDAQLFATGHDVDDYNRPWDLVVVDEAHQIKNPSCQLGRMLRRLISRSRILLTGTPLQNKLSDLWALMDFAQPGVLGNHATFERTFADQIAKGSKKNASSFAVELKDHLARELRRLCAPHFLRRMKSEIQMSATSVGHSPSDLPPKVDVVLWLSITPAQQELYDLCLQSELVKRATGSTKCGLEALRAIALLKKISNHPMLCLPQEDFNDWKLRTVQAGSNATGVASGDGVQCDSSATVGLPVAGDMEDMDGSQIAPECTDMLARLRALVPGSAQGAALLSCKLRVLAILLPQLQKGGHRCLIFSQSTRMLDLIQICVLRVLGLKFLRIDGTIDPKERDLKLKKFHQPDSRYFAICLSKQVGGVGLTITGADRVILVDPAWNPAMDAQAVDRVHRLGQERDVVVYRLIGAGAIEDKMFRLQVYKRGIAQTALEQEQQIRFFTRKDLKALFERPDASASTQSLMAEILGTEALEHEELLKVVANDVGGTDDPQASAFWQSSDVLGFSDYQRLFMYLERAAQGKAEAGEKAKALAARLTDEEYIKDQVVAGRYNKSHIRDEQAKENTPPEQAPIVPHHLEELD